MGDGSTNSTTPATRQAFPDPIPGILTFGSVNIFAGAPGAGKTAMVAEWIARWRDGRTICGRSTNPPTAFAYIAADRQWWSHQKWFDAVGFPSIPHYCIADQYPNFQTLRYATSAPQLFEDCLAHLSPPAGAHVFVDPLAPLFIAGDQNKARDVATTLLHFSRICSARQITLTCIAHFSKQKIDPREQYARPQDRISGSVAFIGFSDTQMYLIDPDPPKQPYHLFGWNPRHAPMEEFQFTRDKKSGLFVPFNLFSEMDRQEAVLRAVPDDPTPTSIIISRISKETGLSRAQAERYLSALIKDGRVVRVRRGVYKKAKPS